MPKITAPSDVVCTPGRNNVDVADQAYLSKEDNSCCPKLIPSSIADTSSTHTNDYYSEPLSSSPPTAFTSSILGLDTDNTTRDSEPVPFSSTPDLGSREASSSPIPDYDSPIVVTPPEERFIRILDSKLQALLNATTKRWTSILSVEKSTKGENKPHVLKPTASIDDYDTTPTSTHSVQSRVSLKRKRSQLQVPYTPTASTRSGDVHVEESTESEKITTTCREIPTPKKLKETSFNYTVTETASARRARSLSACSSYSSLVPTEIDSLSRPSTPIYKVPAVPIIAPPDFSDIPRPPLSPDDASEARLRVLLQKERIFRQREGFEKGFNNILDSSVTKEQVDDLLGIDEDFRKEVITWMLRVRTLIYLSCVDVSCVLRSRQAKN